MNENFRISRWQPWVEFELMIQERKCMFLRLSILVKASERLEQYKVLSLILSHLLL